MKILITGGAGFIGSNTAKRFIDSGNDVIVFDNLSRKGSNSNLNWLKKNGNFSFIEGDLRDYELVKSIFSENGNIDVVIHLAGQVAVTTSVENPREDFEINALGTLNVLEAIRENYNLVPLEKNNELPKDSPFLIFSSTNKVYGEMEDIEIVEKNNKYTYKKYPSGISENTLLDFHSPYGCSKGVADQYVIDYSRIYGIKSVVMRQSCIYGYRQFGIEDQGWVAWFTIASLLEKEITIYGDGKQVRDVLFIDDLVDCYVMAIENMEKINGKAYNIGGGSDNTLSLLELISLLEKFTKKKITPSYSNWRPGDQPVFVCNIERAYEEFGWKPKTSVEDGISKLQKWIYGNKDLFI